ncbi:hypothetical protein CDAR_298841 [Caerostris darwini]|uniref:STPR domain-containing protein n=1 Tax=Caerostris darwini TaxID=1538125 RepID=A0AAV4PUF8_9ARAC|nr:hypothetical protein CDAR_298841 [Caerostris darwini]
MPPKEIAMPRKRRLSKECQNRQDEIPTETSEDRKSSLTNIRERTAEESMAKQQRPSNLETKETKEERETRLEKQRVCQARNRAAESPKQRERILERKRARKAENIAAETAEQRERRLQYMHVGNQRVMETETPGERQRRLERYRTRWSKFRAAETEEQRKDRLEERRKLNARKKNAIKNKENVLPDEPTVAIKDEPTEFHSEPLAPEEYQK